MSVEMPGRVGLPMPPGDPEALADLVQDVAGAAYRLTVLGDRLAGPAADAPGWIGDDAAAAAGQIARVATLSREAADAILEATGRLRAHAECLRDARRGVTQLREEQDEDFRAAGRRLAQIEDPQLAVMTGAPSWVGVIEEVEAAEAARRRRHAALVEEVEADAAATGRVLTRACQVIGGAGSRGDSGRVVAYLASELPGWGDQELAHRARALAQAFGTLLTPEERNALAMAALPYAGSEAFADALFSAMGPVWVRETFVELGQGSYRPDGGLPRLMALAFGAAADEVLSAGYVSRLELDGRNDLVVLGMGTVLAASLALGGRGLRPSTVAAWGRQIAAREHALGASAIDRVGSLGDETAPVDAIPVVVAILAGSPDRTSAAAFLSGADVWDVVLGRAWVDCGTSLHRLVLSAGRVEGREGEAVVRGGLEALAAGLGDGDLSDWPVHRAAANAVTPGLSQAIAARPSVVGEALRAGVDGEVAPSDGDLLRGLGIVTLNRPAAAVVEQALQKWATAQPVPAWVEGPPPVLPAVVVPNAYLAVQNFGREFAHALQEETLKREAEDRAFLWNMTVALAVELAPGPLGTAAGLVEGYVAKWLHVDGSWVEGPDGAPASAPDVPDASALAHLTPEAWTVVDRMARQAEAAFEGTTSAVGHLITVRPPKSNWWDPIVEAAMPGPGDVADVLPSSRGHVPPIR